ncbi:MAG: glycosyltransferase family 2 protein [Gammaproteobacteria bacterium]
MRAIAIIAVRNEIAYLDNLLQHLVKNNIDFAIIDNDSTDGSEKVPFRTEFRNNLAAFEQIEYKGYYDWITLLQAKEKLYKSLDSDWIIHHDADEIMHSYVPNETLHQAIVRISNSGSNVINFDEYVFLPVEQDYEPSCGKTQPLRYYYFFEPEPLRLMRAWKSSLDVSNVNTGGHKIAGDDIVLSKESMALRHYIFQSQEHAYLKYLERSYSKNELNIGWHRNRVGYSKSKYTFPDPSKLENLADPDDRNLLRLKPHKEHYWAWPAPPPPLLKRIRQKAFSVYNSFFQIK